MTEVRGAVMRRWLTSDIHESGDQGSRMVIGRAWGSRPCFWDPIRKVADDCTTVTISWPAVRVVRVPGSGPRCPLPGHMAVDHGKKRALALQNRLLTQFISY